MLQISLDSEYFNFFITCPFRTDVVSDAYGNVFTFPFRTDVVRDAYGVVNIYLSTHYVRQPISIFTCPFRTPAYSAAPRKAVPSAAVLQTCT